MRPSWCQTVRKRSHIRASRHTAQFSTSARIVRRSKTSSVISIVSLARRPRAGAHVHSALTFGADPGETAMTRLAGRTAIVTGGAKGIGAHYSQALAAQGADVVI